MPVITALETYDIRFPTSRELHGSDAMNPDPDYSAAYVILRTDAAADLCGHGFVFTQESGPDRPDSLDPGRLEGRPIDMSRALREELKKLLAQDASPPSSSQPPSTAPRG